MDSAAEFDCYSSQALPVRYFDRAGYKNAGYRNYWLNSIDLQRTRQEIKGLISTLNIYLNFSYDYLMGVVISHSIF